MMTTEDLKSLCCQWNRSSETFSQIVAEALSTLGVYQRELANEFEVAESTVSRWASGIAKPHPKIQELIVTSIKRRTTKSDKANQRNVTPKRLQEDRIMTVTAKSR